MISTERRWNAEWRVRELPGLYNTTRALHMNLALHMYSIICRNEHQNSKEHILSLCIGFVYFLYLTSLTIKGSGGLPSTSVITLALA